MLDFENPQMQELIRRAQRVPSDGYFPGTGLHEQGQRRPNFVPTDEPAPTPRRRHQSSTALSRTPPARSPQQRNEASNLSDFFPPQPASGNGQTNIQVNLYNPNITINNGTPAPAPAPAPAQPAQQESLLASAFWIAVGFVACGVVLFVGYWLITFIIGLLIALLPFIVLGAALVFIVAVCIGIASNF
jgi:hypothetical protein